MCVMSFWDPGDRRPTVDLFADHLLQALTIAYQSGALKAAVHDAERQVEPRPMEYRGQQARVSWH